MNSKTIKTVGDVQASRQLANDLAEHRAIKARNELNLVTAKLAKNPEIGILRTARGAKYYANAVTSQFRVEYVESFDIDVILRALGRIS